MAYTLSNVEYIGSVILQSDTCTPQVVYWVGAMLGAMASLYLTGQVGQQTVDGVSPGLAFLGGVLVLVGARTASGCTRYALYSSSRLVCNMDLKSCSISNIRI